MFVLDVSGSMEDFDRIVRLRQAVKVSIKYTVYSTDYSLDKLFRDGCVMMWLMVCWWELYLLRKKILFTSILHLTLLASRDRGKISTVTPLTEIDETSRTDMITAVSGLNAKGGTCLDLGLLRGKKVLEDGGLMSGGVIIFLTDGIQAYCDGNNERPGWGPEGGISGVIDQIAESGIRVITIAFG